MESRTRRRGFTLVELLVVIGIILVLIAIVVAGIRHTSYMAARHETEAELKVCQDLLTEYKAVNGMKNLEGPASTVTPNYALNLPSAWLNHSYYLPMYLDPIGVQEVTNSQPETAFGIDDFKGTPAPAQGNTGPRPEDCGDMSVKNTGNDPRYVCRAMYNTTGVMFLLLKDPKNRAIVSGMPPKRMLETWPPFNAGGAPQKPFTIDAAVLLDGWGNPIIYVPRGGMHVFMDPNKTGTLTPYLVRSSGTYSDAGVVPPVGPNDHPFFASAGPDGYFVDYNPVATNRQDRSIDNIYSFQAQ